MSQPQTVIATWMLGVVEQFARQGIAPTRLGPSSWIRALAHDSPTRQLQVVQVRRLWHRATEIDPDPRLGLRIGAALPLQAMNVVAVMIMHSASLRQAIGLTVRYQGLISNSGRFELAAQDGGARLRYRIRPAPVSMHPAQIDSVFAGYLGFVRRCAPAGTRPARVLLPGTPGGALADYEREFGCPVTLGAAEPGAQFSVDALDAPWTAADPALRRLAIVRADTMLQAQGRSDALVDHVTAAVSAVGYERASCAAIARTLGLSTRTLQRRLGHARTTFRKLVEAARMDEALQLLGETSLPLGRIAERLGYGDASALSHAVRKHFGASPRALRAHLAPTAASPTSRESA
jgi:AraC-like DNA-binding protein